MDDTGSNSVKNDEEMAPNGRYFMCQEAGDKPSPRIQVDPLEPVTESVASSSLGSVARGLRSPHRSRLGSSAARAFSSLPVGASAAAQPDPSTGGASPQLDSLGSGEVVAPVVLDVAPRSNATPPDTPMNQWPSTRLQHDISKPKFYSDGIVRWCMLGTSAAGEPSSVAEALNDER
jgi:hypothetical protein